MRDTEKLKNILVDLLREECVEEAFHILTKCDDKWYNSFLEEVDKKSENTACIAIDFAKVQLVKDGKMVQKDGDNFGNIGDFFYS